MAPTAARHAVAPSAQVSSAVTLNGNSSSPATSSPSQTRLAGVLSGAWSRS